MLVFTTHLLAEVEKCFMIKNVFDYSVREKQVAKVENCKKYTKKLFFKT